MESKPDMIDEQVCQCEKKGGTSFDPFKSGLVPNA